MADHTARLELKHRRGMIVITIKGPDCELTSHVSRSIQNHFNGNCRKNDDSVMDFARLFAEIGKHG